VGTQISSRQGLAVDATNAVIGAGFDGSRIIAEGETRLRHTRIAGRLQLAGAQLRNPSGAALGAGRCRGRGVACGALVFWRPGRYGSPGPGWAPIWPSPEGAELVAVWDPAAKTACSEILGSRSGE